jgi:excisionase family DNA binding protein
MADQMPDTVTIGEAAALLGVHRNTVRNRIKAGHYTAHKVVTPQGETYVIERESLGITPDNWPHNPSQTTVHHNAHIPYQGTEIADVGPQAQSLALVQRLLAPFVEELGATKLELGRVQERLSTAEQERDKLREVDRVRQVLADQLRIATAELMDARAEVELLRAIPRPDDIESADIPCDQRTAPTVAPGRAEPPESTSNTLDEPSIVAAWLRRLFGRT